MPEKLLILTDEDLDDELLREVANDIYLGLVERGVDVNGVAPVLNPDCTEGDDE